MTGRAGLGGAVRRRPGQLADCGGAPRDQRVHRRHPPAPQRLHVELGAWRLPRRGRHRPGRSADPGDHVRALQGSPTGPQAAGLEDLKQLVWILTVSADGAVPLAYRLADGNTVDDPTHVPTWDGLVGLLGRTDFLYVADSKLCSRAAMGHLDSRGGRFVTVMPRSRAEDGAFRKHLQTHTPVWTEAARRPGARQGDPDQVYSTTPALQPSVEGYRIVWVHSTAKASRDAHARAARINSGVAALEALDATLAGPRCRFKTRIAVEQAATIALTDTGADRWVTATVTQTTTKTYKQARAGRPGPKT